MNQPDPAEIEKPNRGTEAVAAAGPTVTFDAHGQLFCLDCATWVTNDHPSPPDYSNHKFIFMERVYVSLDGFPLYCLTCKRSIKGAGGHKDHAIVQMVSTPNDAQDIVSTFDRYTRVRNTEATDA